MRVRDIISRESALRFRMEQFEKAIRALRPNDAACTWLSNAKMDPRESVQLLVEKYCEFKEEYKKLMDTMVLLDQPDVPEAIPDLGGDSF